MIFTSATTQVSIIEIEAGFTTPGPLGSYTSIIETVVFREVFSPSVFSHSVFDVTTVVRE